jgi:lipopolysaccharide/colanic/teichoic acid biosynthesis glycosyltransferase
MRKKGFGVHYSVFVGYDLAHSLPLDEFSGFSELGYEIKGIISKDISKSGVYRTKEGLDFNTYPLSMANEILSKDRIDRVFVPSALVFANGFSPVMEICRQRHIKVNIVSSESEELLRFSHVKDLAGISVYSPPRRKTEFMKAKSKRIGDLIASVILLIVLLPVISAVSIAILLEDGKPIFYKQKRALVKGYREFWFYKFRSMERNAEEKQAKLYEKNQTDGGLFLLKSDPRLTKVGRYIRKYSLDELPQLINVLKGDMSLVGPRPLSIADLSNIVHQDHLEEAFKLRAKAKPGMTGLWQICGRREVAFKEMLLLDLYYIENQSLIFDLEILFATIPVVMFGKGAY